MPEHVCLVQLSSAIAAAHTLLSLLCSSTPHTPAPLQFDEYGGMGGGYGRPAAQAPEPTRRSSRRAAAAGVARLTAALHGPSEFDEDE